MYVKSFNDRGIWKDTSLSDEQEQEVRAIAIKRHQEELYSCFGEAKTLLKAVMQHGEIPPAVLANIAVALFEKRATPLQYVRESKAREVFERANMPKMNIGIDYAKGKDYSHQAEQIKINENPNQGKSELEQAIKKAGG